MVPLWLQKKAEGSGTAAETAGKERGEGAAGRRRGRPGPCANPRVCPWAKVTMTVDF